MRSAQERLRAWDRPIVTDYELGVLITQSVEALGAPLDLYIYTDTVETLRAFGLIAPSKDFKAGAVFHLFGHNNPLQAAVACAVDPFAYVSHLSAMEYHGLTDRFTKILYLSTPPDKEWKEHALARMEKDLGDYKTDYLAESWPALRHHKFERIDGTRVELLRRSQRGAFKSIRSSVIRVAMIGRTFLDMVREPQYCGGMQHVVDTYRAYAAQYLKLIVDEVERHGKSIEQTRAGYLLDEVCGLKDPLIDSWAAKVQRGGSRKLDPQEEYAPIYSEKWLLSVNVPSLSSPQAGQAKA